jgi:hypothetical protein
MRNCQLLEKECAPWNCVLSQQASQKKKKIKANFFIIQDQQGISKNKTGFHQSGGLKLDKKN